MKHRHYLVTGTLLFFGAAAYGQLLTPEVIASGGEVLTAGGYSLASTVGELVTTTEQPGNMLTQGFQQPDDIGTWIVPVSSTMRMNVYPNPTSSFTTLHTEGYTGTLCAVLYDATGRELDRVTSSNGNMTLNLQLLAPALYMIRVTDENGKALESFHVQKIQ